MEKHGLLLGLFSDRKQSRRMKMKMVADQCAEFARQDGQSWKHVGIFWLQQQPGAPQLSAARSQLYSLASHEPVILTYQPSPGAFKAKEC